VGCDLGPCRPATVLDSAVSVSFMVWISLWRGLEGGAAGGGRMGLLPSALTTPVLDKNLFMMFRTAGVCLGSSSISVIRVASVSNSAVVCFRILSDFEGVFSDMVVVCVKGALALYESSQGL
jgi:hypothetical protein